MLAALDREIGRLLVGIGLAQRGDGGQLVYRPEYNCHRHHHSPGMGSPASQLSTSRSPSDELSVGPNPSERTPGDAQFLIPGDDRRQLWTQEAALGPV